MQHVRLRAAPPWSLDCGLNPSVGREQEAKELSAPSRGSATLPQTERWTDRRAGGERETDGVGPL